jgi:hypothetical protein
MVSLSSKRSQTSKFCIYKTCLLDMRTALAPHLSQCSAADQLERAGYSRTTFRRKTVGGCGEGGVYYTRPSLPIAIKYKLEPVAMRVNIPVVYMAR